MTQMIAERINEIRKNKNVSVQTIVDNGISKSALMLDLRTDFSLPCKLIAEEHFLYDSIFTRI